MYAAPVTLPVAPADESELTLNEALEVVEPTDVNQVWVVARLSGSEDVITLRSSTWVSSLCSAVLLSADSAEFYAVQWHLLNGSGFRRSLRPDPLPRSFRMLYAVSHGVTILTTSHILPSLLI